MRRVLSISAISGAGISVLLCACATAPSPPAATPTFAAQPAASAAGSGVPASSQAAGLPGNPSDFVVNYTGGDGSKFQLTFSLYPMLKGGDPALASFFPGGAPCTADPQRDGVIAGTLTMTNETPSFSVDVGLILDNGGTPTFGGAFGNGSMCIPTSEVGELNPLVSTTLNNQWGPVNVEFVYPGAYSPDNPDGAGAVTGNEPELTAYEDSIANQFTATSFSSNVTEGTAMGSVTMNVDSLDPGGSSAPSPADS
jgi:hypothetical protein